jgi:ribonuclease VapC
MTMMECRNERPAMIALDTSALMAVVLDDVDAESCMRVLATETEIVISAATIAEALIVAARRNVGQEMTDLIDGSGFEVITVTPAMARRVADAYARWGKGVHRASLNFGDCFAYVIATDYACPLLFVGDDFSRTDLERAVPSQSDR